MAWGDPVSPAVLTPGSPEWCAKRDEKLLAWDASKKALEVAKETEMNLRKEVGEFVFPTDGRKEGVNNHELGNGYTLKLGHKVNYKLVGPNDKIIEVEERAEKVGNEGKFIIERLITWKADISVTEYKKLKTDANEGSETAKEILKIVDEVVETSSGAPSLEIKEPKAKLNG
jgi:hypothetical protein